MSRVQRTLGTLSEQRYLRLALRLAKRGYGRTSPNPMVGAVLVRGERIIGRGWHRRAGEPHAEIVALRDAQLQGHSARGSTLYVTLEPCCTHGRTPPCTDAIIQAGVKRVVAGARDPNPRHRGKGFRLLQRAGLEVAHGVMAQECEGLNEAFNHWIVRRTPFVTVKAAMTLDGKIATAAGDSKWITSPKAREWGMKLRQGSDAILVGINTVLADDPSLTFRGRRGEVRGAWSVVGGPGLRRIVLDAQARTPLAAKVVTDDHAGLTTIVVSPLAPKARVAALAKRVRVRVVPIQSSRSSASADQGRLCLDLHWLLRGLGAEDVTSLLVEGGGEINASFLLGRLAQRVAFFYAPKVLGGRNSLLGVAGQGARRPQEILDLSELQWRWLGPDLLLSARVGISPS